MPDIEELDIIDEGQVEEELYEHYSLVVDKGQSLMRIDKFLSGHMENVTRSRIQAALGTGSIRVNEKPTKASYKIKPFDKISIVLPYPEKESSIIPEDIPIDIVYEDEHVIVVNKPAGLVVHPGHGNYHGTLVNALHYYFKDLPLFQSGDMRTGLVHRIDKDTSGLLVVAKDEYTHVGLAEQFFYHTIERRYHALIWGTTDSDEGTIVGNIGRSLKDRMKMTIYPEGSEMGKHAVTHYKVLERFAHVTLIECRLETGRTHQIRVHFADNGHPLFGDPRYGGDKILRGTTSAKYKQFVDNCLQILPRQALHALSLGFIHPVTGEHLYFESTYPEDFRTCIEKWRKYSSQNQ